MVVTVRLAFVLSKEANAELWFCEDVRSILNRQ
jgi:hypothetical protein